jgi:hypothetical protein
VEILASEFAKELKASATTTYGRPRLIGCLHQLNRGVIHMAERNSYHVVPGEDVWREQSERAPLGLPLFMTLKPRRLTRLVDIFPDLAAGS